MTVKMIVYDILIAVFEGRGLKAKGVSFLLE